jgi:hypothetical protein
MRLPKRIEKGSQIFVLAVILTILFGGFLFMHPDKLDSLLPFLGGVWTAFIAAILDLDKGGDKGE